MAINVETLGFIASWCICLKLYLLGSAGPLLGRSKTPGLLLGNRLVLRKRSCYHVNPWYHFRGVGVFIFSVGVI